MEDSKKLFKTGWVSGPSAVLEIFTPPSQEDGDYFQLKYTPPFHSTIRPPVQKTPIGPQQLGRMSERIDGLVQIMGGRSPGSSGAGNPAGAAPGAIQTQMKTLGLQVINNLFSTRIQVKSDMKTGGLFLELGIDEALLHIPWELMHDGENFICLKNAFGRFVNARTMEPFMMAKSPTDPIGSVLENLSVLIICVPKPMTRDDEDPYDELNEAFNEGQTLCEILGDAGLTVKFLQGKNATYDNVWNALQGNKNHIIHYIGHAYFDDKNPDMSGLALYDRDMTTGEIQGAISDNPPSLCFINGCETARSWNTTENKRRFDIYGLARAFLNNGTYLIGNRWRINDKTASIFSTRFYSALFQQRKSVGWAIVDARQGCLKESLEDVFGWASYIYYGDPRVCFCM